MVSPLGSQCPFLLGGPWSPANSLLSWPSSAGWSRGCPGSSLTGDPAPGPEHGLDPSPLLPSCSLQLLGCGRLRVPATARGMCGNRAQVHAVLAAPHMLCVQPTYTNPGFTFGKQDGVCERAEKADTCMEMRSALQALTLPFQGELKSLKQTVQEGSVPSESSTHPAFLRSPQQPPMNPESLSHASWGQPGRRETEVLSNRWRS